MSSMKYYRGQILSIFGDIIWQYDFEAKDETEAMAIVDQKQLDSMAYSNAHEKRLYQLGERIA